MRKIVLSLFVIAIIGLFITTFATTSEAAKPFHAGRGFYGFPYNQFAYGNGFWPYTLGFVPVPPYYALHPPVYYSAPVPRTYGYSPYPYPGHVRTPEIKVAVPKEIMNPHVKPQAKKASNRTARLQPRVIINQYVIAESDKAGGLVLAK